MIPDEADAIRRLGWVAAKLGVRLPASVLAELRSALGWAEADPLRNALTPGHPPLEYSFSTWMPREFRVAAYLYAGQDPVGRRAKTVDLARRMAGFAPWEVHAEPSPSRFGAFFGLSAAQGAITGVECYLEAVAGEERISWLPRLLREAAEPATRLVFTGVGIRNGKVMRRAYFAVTRELNSGELRQVVCALAPASPAAEMNAALTALTCGRPVLSAGTVVITSAEGGGLWSVDLHAPSYGVEFISLTERVPRLRDAAFVRWATAIGGCRALATVVSVRWDEWRGPGVAVYAVPAWGCQPMSRSMACPPCSTELTCCVDARPVTGSRQRFPPCRTFGH